MMAMVQKALANKPALAVQVLIALLFALLSHYFYYAIGDDAYIYFRYVDRALIGEGWSWSSQIPPAEGYSSPLWYGLLIVFSKMGMGVESVARVLGLLCSFASLVLCYRLGRLLSLKALPASLACLLLVLNTGFHYWSTAGLETSLYSLVFIAAVIGMVQLRYWIIPLALIGVLRPEGPILLLALLVCMKVFYRQQVAYWQLLLAALPALIWLGIRLDVYGLPLPNTFYAKATGEPIAQINKGVFYALPILLPFLFCWWQWRLIAIDETDHSSAKVKAASTIALGAMSLLIGIVIIGGGDWMFHFRLLQPILGILLVVMMASAVAGSWFKRGLLLLLSLPLLSLSIMPWHFSAALQGEQLAQRYYQEGELLPASKAVADAIAQRYRLSAAQPKVIAVNHAGMVPFLLKEQNFIDMVGLNDAHIAQAKGNVHKKFDMDYVLAAKPDLIILNSRTEPGTDGQYYHKGYWSGENALVDMPLFKQHYRPANIVADWHWQLIFPYSLFIQSYHSWIMVYERIE